MKGLYIHVPFCHSRCIYCDFFSTTSGKEQREQYVQTLCKEIGERRNYGGAPRLASIYLGGGTPSTLSAEQLALIFQTIGQHYSLCPDAEITLEANPDDVVPSFVEAIKALPINRVSLGIQTFDDEILKLLRRRHSTAQAKEAVRLLHSSGIENISIDLIYGLPGQGMDHWEADLEQMAQLPIAHLSAYALIYEEGTPIEKMRQRGTVKEAAEELSLAMYRRLISKTREMGMKHYEISNFAMPGLEAKHNSSYWDNKPYVGCGPGAHSYDGTRRRFNLPELNAYCNGDIRFTTEELTPEERFNERIMTALRTCQGLNLSELESEFSHERRNALLESAASYIRKGLMAVDNERLLITQEGIFLSDMIISDLMMV